jgi:hypothetical protein
MQSAPWWITSLVSFLAALLGAFSAILSAWLTQKQDLAKQIAIRQLDHERDAREALLKEKQQRYVTILQNLESLYNTPQADIAARGTLLRTVRESWLFGDEAIVKAIGGFLNEIAKTPAEAGPQELAIGNIVLLMREDLGVQPGSLTTSDFRFHKA